MLPGFYIFCAAIIATSSAEDEAYTVSIITIPDQGPFRLSQQVQFSCAIDPLPPDSVVYQWRTVEGVNGNSFSGQNFSRTYRLYGGYLPHCYYYCQVLVNGTLVGSASKLVEVQGVVYTHEPVVRSFIHGGYLELNVNISTNPFGITNNSLVWYHNDTRLFSGDRHTITNDNTKLVIRDMLRDFDAGVYKAASSYSCDSVPTFTLAELAPVTFTVEENSVPVYNPLSIFPTHYVNDTSETLLLNESVQTVISPYQLSSGNYWYKNATRITDDSMNNVMFINLNGLTVNSLQTLYNRTEDVTGIYMTIVWVKLYDYIYYRHCLIAYRYLDYYFRYQFPTGVLIWNIKANNPPLSVHLDFAESILTQLESTTVECTAVGGQSPELFSLTLWRGDQLLAQENGGYLSYSTAPQSYGTYTCAIDGLQNSSVLQERVHFQMLFNDITATQCHQLGQSVVYIREAILATLRTLCQQCSSLHLSNIQDTHLNCSISRAYFTAALVYSGQDGKITASTLTNMFLVWLLSEDTPALMVGGTRFTLSQKCPTQLNAITEVACINIVNSGSASSPDSASLAVGVFFSGLIAGVVLTVITISLIFCIRRVKSSTTHEQPLESHAPAGDESLEMTTSPNQAYETVDTRYQTGRLGQNSEIIYEVPEV